jgi:cytochrome c oxidase subunit 2
MFFTPLTFVLPQASTIAADTDALYNFIWWVSAASLIPTCIAMLWFAWEYRETKNKKPVPYIAGNHVFEWTVSLVLSVVFVVIFVWGLIGYNKIYDTPRGAYEINVIGQQWMWSFQYANGKTSSSDLYVPRGVPIKLIMTSRDVIHDFYVPNFRLKQDVVPGMNSTLWFEAIAAGENQIFCAQYCGTSHSNMIGKVIVLEPDQFKVWLNGGDPAKMNVLQIGEHLFKQRNCVACHSVKTSAEGKPGPGLGGLFGHAVALSDGSSVTADEGYLYESIVNPSAKIVKGFSPIMPIFKGVLSEEEVNSLVTYIKSLKE